MTYSIIATFGKKCCHSHESCATQEEFDALVKPSSFVRKGRRKPPILAPPAPKGSEFCGAAEGSCWADIRDNSSSEAGAGLDEDEPINGGDVAATSS